MKILLDTHAVLWWLNGDTKFSQQATDLVSDPANDVLVSSASLWEMLVKARVGKLTVDMRKLMAEMQAQDLRLLGIEPAHLLALGSLPRLHGDPWDHLLIAQAIAEEAVFLSEDGHTPYYPVNYVTCSGAKPPQMGGQLPAATSRRLASTPTSLIDRLGQPAGIEDVALDVAAARDLGGLADSS